jgi:hypothetical protein
MALYDGKTGRLSGGDDNFQSGKQSCHSPRRNLNRNMSQFLRPYWQHCFMSHIMDLFIQSHPATFIATEKADQGEEGELLDLIYPKLSKHHGRYKPKGKCLSMKKFSKVQVHTRVQTRIPKTRYPLILSEACPIGDILPITVWWDSK